jgi:hypothetical protein
MKPDMPAPSTAQGVEASTLPPAPLWGFLTLPRGRLLKVHAEPCMYAPGYLQSNKPRWPRSEA